MPTPTRTHTGARLAAAAALLAVAAACATTAAGGTAPFEDVDWRLLDVGGQPAVAGPSPVRIRFRSDSLRTEGDAGCNRFGGPYVRDGASLRIGPLFSTKRACADEAANRQETAVLGALEATRRYGVSGDTLVLSGDGGPLVRWVR